MRPKIVLTVIGFAMFTVVLLVLMRNRIDEANKSHSANPNAATAQPSTPSPTSATAERSTNIAVDTAVAGTTADEVAIEPGNPLKRKPAAIRSGVAQSLTHEEYVEQRVGELMDLGMTDDPEALKTILSELNNSDSDIRRAAVEAAKQFGSADAIPKLEEALSSAESPDDKQELREAIEFLKLPSFLAKKS